MNISAAGIVVLLAAVAATPPTKAAQQRATGAACMPLDALATAMLAGLRRVVSGSAPEQVATRDYQKLPITAPSSVSYVTDNSVCSKAEAAYTAAVDGTPPATPSQMVRVFKVGNVFVVHDTAQRAGDWYVAMTLSKSYKVLAKYFH